MYFIVFLQALRKNVILPASWIYEVEDHFEKFMNKSINSTQWFLCYYTDKNSAFINGCPDEKFEPDFDKNIINKINPGESFDGCFLGRLTQFKRKYIHFDINSIFAE